MERFHLETQTQIWSLSTLTTRAFTQVAITLSDNSIVYFELDRAGQLNEYADRMTSPHPVCVLHAYTRLV